MPKNCTFGIGIGIDELVAITGAERAQQRGILRDLGSPPQDGLAILAELYQAKRPGSHFKQLGNLQ